MISEAPCEALSEKTSSKKLHDCWSSKYLVRLVTGRRCRPDLTSKIKLRKPSTDAILYSEDFVALAGMHALHEMGIRIPQDVAVVGINNSRYSEMSIPTLTTIDNMLYDTSLIAVRNLLEVLKGERVNHRMSILSELVQRNST